MKGLTLSMWREEVQRVVLEVEMLEVKIQVPNRFQGECHLYPELFQIVLPPRW